MDTAREPAIDTASARGALSSAEQRACPVDHAALRATACPVGARSDSRADRVVRRLLRIPEPTSTSDREEAAERLFSVAMILSGLRCTLSYVIIPFVLPALGLGAVAGFGPEIGIPVGVLALIFDVRGIRRFHVARHRWRWSMTAIYLAVIALVTYLVVQDIVALIH
ncbi:hypothetical protein Afer_1930 [Acidimicrobium ferrooxidans DSM 10331]|uniref:Uncharacterized protein n=1 Tax=Acidimicrobium ferrooxidans (strain DSM 10331 / JCM 15462 / NBRC 103882 / ICP) TaxID=525909 RepID=C7M1T7_ACIFD|nr:hypothetical protein [Acidimicrobium ferrooxidans]ACU54834.1 hypothetical protein Afer_1930 [Acidimicrobium ferrooxidans DSM 10331]